MRRQFWEENTMNEKMMKLLAKETKQQFDGGAGEDRLHFDEERINVYASLMTEKQYQAMEKLLNKKVIKGKGYLVHAWNDSSGYKYWSKDEDDANYIQVTVCIQDMNKIDPDQLKKDVQTLFDFFHGKYDNTETYYSKKVV